MPIKRYSKQADILGPKVIDYYVMMSVEASSFIFKPSTYFTEKCARGFMCSLFNASSRLENIV